MAPQQGGRQHIVANLFFFVSLLGGNFIIGHATQPGAVDLFSADTYAVETEIKKVLEQGQFSNWKVLQASFETGAKAFTTVQTHAGFKDSLELLEDNVQLLETLNGDNLAKAMAALKKYTPKLAKNKNMKQIGKFAKLDRLSKLSRFAKEDAKEAVDEVLAQQEILQQQVARSRKLAGAQAVFQLVESSFRCYSAVSSYLEHANKLGEWERKITEWTKLLNENREHMRLVIQLYLQTGEWDISQISMMLATANEVLGDVKYFNSQMLEAKKAAASQRFDGGMGILSNSFNAALNIMQAIASPAPILSAMVGASHVVSAAADSAAVVFAQLDLNLLEGNLQRGEVLLRESLNQVDQLKRGQSSIRKGMKSKLKSQVDKPQTRHESEEL